MLKVRTSLHSHGSTDAEDGDEESKRDQSSRRWAVLLVSDGADNDKQDCRSEELNGWNRGRKTESQL